MRTLQGVDLIWAVWPDTGLSTRLEHGLAMLKGAFYLAANDHVSADARFRVVRLMFPSVEEAQRICAVYGNDAPYQQLKAFQGLE